MIRQTSWLVLVSALLVTSVAHADYADDGERACAQKLQGAWELALARAETLAEADRQLSALAKPWAEGKACAPKYRDLQEMVAGLQRDVPKKQKLRADLKEWETLVRETDALVDKLSKADVAGVDALLPEGNRLAAQIDDLETRSELRTGRYSRKIADAFDHRREEFTRARTQAASARTQAEHDHMRKIAVVARLGLTPTDAYDLAKVGDAFARSTANDLVVANGSKDDGDFEFAPAGTSHNKIEVAGFAKEPALGGDVELSEGRVDFAFAKRPGPPPQGTTGLVWSVDGERAVFVTVDGGRYETLLRRLSVDRTTTSSTGEVINVVLTPGDVAKLVEAGQLAPKYGRELARLTKAATTCGDGVWKRAEPTFDAISTANITSETRRNRNNALRTKTLADEDRSCGSHMRAYRKVWTSAIEERRTQRLKLLDAVRKLEQVSSR